MFWKGSMYQRIRYFGVLGIAIIVPMLGEYMTMGYVDP